MATKQTKYANWNRAHDRLMPEAWPELNPSFVLPAGAKIMTFGSCFARNIEANLSTLGFIVPTAAAQVPDNEWPPADNQFLNRYSPATILADIETADLHLSHADGYDPAVSERYMITLSDGMVIDGQFPGYVAVSRDRFHERRKELLDLNKNAFDADCVTITLGMVETFYDTENETYLCAAPTGRVKQERPDRFVFKRLTMMQAYGMIERTVEIIKARNPDVKILITTSPISLNRTFTEDDVIIANCYSKSLLRTVCGQITENFDNVDYFPSYETATMTKTWDIYDPDLVHLKKNFVSKIVSRLVDYYFTEVSPASVGFQRSYAAFQERDYETAKDEVLKAIALDPDNAEILAHAGTVMRSLGETEQMAAYFRRSAEIKPSAIILSHLATALSKMTKVDEALEVLKEAISLEPAKQSLHLQKALLLIRTKDFAAAETEVDFVLTENPRNIHAVIQKLDILQRNTDHEQILTVASTALQNVGGGHKDRLRAFIARAHLELGDIDRAEQYYSTAAAGSKFFAGFEEELEAKKASA